MGKDFYAILQVSKDVSDAELKKAYKTQAMKWHPDKHSDPEKKKTAETMFKDIAEAYNVLSNKETKAIYDRHGEDGLKYGDSAGENTRNVYHAVDPSELFSKFFGSDKTMFFNGFDDDFGSSFKGFTTDQTFSFGGNRVDLGGNGVGLGGNTHRNNNNNIFMNLQQQQTDHTHIPKHTHNIYVSLEELFTGSRKKMKVTRKRFKGKLTYEDTVLVVDIKPGWKDGTKITFSGDGDQESPNSLPGDIVFVVKTKPHSTFTRDGNNLKVKRTVTLLEALTGYTFQVNTIDNKTKKIEINEVISPTYKKVILNEGMPLSKSPKERGSLIIEFDITFPKILKTQHAKALGQILA